MIRWRRHKRRRRRQDADDAQARTPAKHTAPQGELLGRGAGLADQGGHDGRRSAARRREADADGNQRTATLPGQTLCAAVDVDRTRSQCEPAGLLAAVARLSAALVIGTATRRPKEESRRALKRKPRPRSRKSRMARLAPGARDAIIGHRHNAAARGRGPRRAAAAAQPGESVDAGGGRGAPLR